MERIFDNRFFYFPLCLLTMSKDKEEILNNIISYCIIEKALRYKYDVLDISEFGFDEDTIKDEVYDYDLDEPLHNKILKADDFFSIKLGGITRNIKNHDKVRKYINNCRFRNGKDSYAAIGKELVFDCRDKGFSFEHFKILCAINSIIGKKKKFVRITYERIKYAMHGYRSKLVYENENPLTKLLSDKQLKNRIEFLNSKKFFSKFTYARRQIYYSTRINSDEELKEAVKKSKIYWEMKKLQLEDSVGTNEIKKELLKIKQESDVLSIEQKTLSRTLNESKKIKLLRFSKAANN